MFYDGNSQYKINKNNNAKKTNNKTYVCDSSS